MKFDRITLAFAVFFPVVFTFIYFEWLAQYGGAYQQIAYAIGKSIQFSLPIVWLGLVHKKSWLLRRPNTKGLIEGFLFGVLIFAAMLFLYHVYFSLPENLLNSDSAAADTIRSRIKGLGFGSPFLFISLGLFYSIIHSGLEEYYWRFFVFRFGETLLDWKIAILLSSFGFTLHHIVILGNFFGYGNIWTYFFSLCVGVGGAYWAFLYRRSDSIWGPWLSHGIIDVAIFVVGYEIIF